MFDPHTGYSSLLKLRQFHLPRFASVHSVVSKYQHCGEGTCDGLASGPGESVQLHSNRRFPQSMRSQGNVSVAGHVMRVDRGDVFARFCFVRKR